MRSISAPLRWLPALLVAACTSGSEGEPSEVETRLAAIDERLATIESRLDAVTSELAIVVAHTRAQQAEEAEREAARVEREQRRRELTERRRSPWSGPDDTDPVTPRPSSELEGAAEGIECREASPTSTACTVDRARLDHLMADPAALARQARIVPAVRDGETLGFKLYGLRRGSLPKLLGFENGDLVESVNGEALGSLDAALDVYTKLRSESRFELQIERRGMPRSLEIEIIE